MNPAGAADYDLIVIGAGPGGRSAALRAAGLGWRTCLLEQSGRVGGVPVWWGEVPLSALRAAACAAQGRTGEWLPARQAAMAASASAGAAALAELLQSGVHVHAARGRLDGPGRVLAGREHATELMTAGCIILAAGCRPAGLPGAARSHWRFGNVEDLLQWDSLPATAAVVGGGRVGVELAGVLNAFGTRVSLIEAETQLLPGMDPGQAGILAEALARSGVDLHLSTRAREIAADDHGARLVLADRVSKGRAVLSVERVLAATGPRPQTGDLGLDTVAVVRDRRGFIQVDSSMQTAQAGLYAVGDIVPTLRLAEVARAEGVAAIEHAAGLPVAPVRHQRAKLQVGGPCGMAAVGLTAEAAAAEGRLAGTLCADLPTCGKGCGGELDAGQIAGQVKLVFDRESGTVLGVHVVGADAGAWLAGAATAVGRTVGAPAWQVMTGAGGGAGEHLARLLSAQWAGRKDQDG